HPVNFHRKQTRRVCILLASVILLSALLTGCDLFLNKKENNLLSEIDDALDYANAAVLPVSVDEGGMGTAVPRGSIVGVKQGYPFTLSYTAKTEYPFLGWQARIEGSSDIISVWEPSGAAGPDITWEPVNAAGTEIRVTIHINPGKTILIGPLKASMPFVNVTVAEVDSGVSTPGGALTGVKQDISFSLRFNPYPAYGFIGWEASLDGVPLGQEEVEFSNRKSMETTVTVHINPEDKTVSIRPLGEGANSAWDFSPVWIAGISDPVDRNAYIQIRFTKPVDPKTFWFEPYTTFHGISDPPDADNVTGYLDTWAREYKHLQIEMADESFSSGAHYRVENFFNPPVLSADGTVLTIWARPRLTTDTMGKAGAPYLSFYGNQFRESKYINVTLDGSIQDQSGLSMGTGRRWTYQIYKNTEAGHTATDLAPKAYGSGVSTLPANMGSALILEANTSGAIHNEDFAPVYLGRYRIIIPADNTPRKVYMVFQATYSRWPVIGGRLLEMTIGGKVEPYGFKTDAVFLLEEDYVLRERLIEAYKNLLKSSSETTYYPDLPIYVAQYDIPANSEAKTENWLLVPRVPGEPSGSGIATSGMFYGNSTLQGYMGRPGEQRLGRAINVEWQ
ncbi:hypothetical protein LQZ19_02770, partial [Treponema primitia]|uniref:hypothetical protein n=1 Tax=Treponema primitia TaxID=88058 RepID=UPI00397F8338